MKSVAKTIKETLNETFGTDAQWEYGMGVHSWKNSISKNVDNMSEDEFINYVADIAKQFYYISGNEGYNHNDILSDKDNALINEIIDYIKYNVHSFNTSNGNEYYLPENEDDIENYPVSITLNDNYLVVDSDDNDKKMHIKFLKNGNMMYM